MAPRSSRDALAAVLLLPLGLVWLLLLTAGRGDLASSLTVRYRDIISALPFLLQVGVFLAPVGYPLASWSGRSARSWSSTR